MCAGQFHGEGVAYFEGGHMYKVEHQHFSIVREHILLE